jgi:hypothetical protein
MRCAILYAPAMRFHRLEAMTLTADEARFQNKGTSLNSF